MVPLPDDFPLDVTRARLLARRGDLAGAREILERVVAGPAASDEARALLLEVEKDQMHETLRQAAKSDVDPAPRPEFGRPLQTVALGFIGAAMVVLAVIVEAPTLAVVFTHGPLAPVLTYSREQGPVTVPAWYTLLPALGFGAIGAFMATQATKDWLASR